MGCALSLWACGGSTSAAPGAASAQAAVELPAQPQLPDDPLRLLPVQPNSVFSADVAALRTSPLFARATRLAERSGCVDTEAVRGLLDRTRRVVIASYGPKQAGDSAALPIGSDGVVVFRGQFTAGAAREALTQWVTHAKAASEPIVEEPRGRFTVLRTGRVAAAQLDERLLAFGTYGAIDALLSVADGKTATWLSGPPFMRNIDSSAWLGTHTLSLLTRADTEVERRLDRSLSKLGAGDVSEGLAGSPAALALTLDGGARAEVRLLYADAGIASRVGGKLRSLIDQASMLLRFAGLSFGLERTQVTTDDAHLAIALELSAQQVDQLTDQLESIIAEGAPQCETPPAGGM